MVKNIIKKAYTILVYLFLYLPIFFLILYSFNDSKYRGNWRGFTLRWYRELFQDSTIISALYNTLIIATLAAIIATIIGTITAVAIHHMNPKAKIKFINLIYIPVINPDIVTGISLLALFVWFKLNLGFMTLLIAHITFNIPYVVLAVLPKLKQLNPHLEEAALDLGASPLYAFYKVILPEIMPGVIAGALLSFTLSLDDFIVSFFTTGSGISTLSISIYSMTKRGVSPKINALSTIMFVSVFLILLIVELSPKKSIKEGRINMQRLIILIVCFTLILSLVGCYEKNTSNNDIKTVNSKKRTLNVYNVGDYINPKLIKEFEKEYKIKVNYEEYATNEEMLAKIQAGGTNYDVIVPSDYMIEEMRKQNLLLKLNFNNIPNYKNIMEEFKGKSFDPKDEYSVPYFWGTMGIVYNKKLVKEEINSWDALWNTKYKGRIVMIDGSRDTIGITLKKLGYSLNSTNTQELKKAEQELIRQKPLVMAYQVDTYKDMMISEEAVMSLAWSGDAMFLIAENPNLDYVVPKEGTNVWVDSMCIPITSKHKSDAELFINYMLRPSIGKENSEYVGYSTPNSEVKKILPKEILEDKIAYPSDDVLKNGEVFNDLGEYTSIYDRMWTEIKSY